MLKRYPELTEPVPSRPIYCIDGYAFFLFNMTKHNGQSGPVTFLKRANKIIFEFLHVLEMFIN
jgi:hypothetical protein